MLILYFSIYGGIFVMSVMMACDYVLNSIILIGIWILHMFVLLHFVKCNTINNNTLLCINIVG